MTADRAGAMVELAALPPSRHSTRYDWACEVAALLAAALARDDERRRLRCPRCGRRYDETRP